MDSTEQIVGFLEPFASYDERGWAEKPLMISRMGDTSSALVANVFFSSTLNDRSPSARNPVYDDAVEIFWKAGETEVKEVPIRIKAGSVQVEPLLIEATLKLPVNQAASVARGRGNTSIYIYSEFTTPYDDKSDLFKIALKNNISDRVIVNASVDSNVSPFLPPSVNS